MNALPNPFEFSSAAIAEPMIRSHEATHEHATIGRTAGWIPATGASLFISADVHPLPAETTVTANRPRAVTVRGLDFEVLWRAITDDFVEFIDEPWS